MARIFLSYAHEDQAAAKRVVAGLSREELEAWWDHDIPPGRTWDEVIGARISAADIVIVLWSKRSVASNFVKEEAQLALDAGKLLPLRIEDVEPPIGFRRVQAANVSDWRGESDHGQWRVALTEIQNRLGDSPMRPTAPPIPRLGIALALSGAVAIAAVALFSNIGGWGSIREVQVSQQEGQEPPAPAAREATETQISASAPQGARARPSPQPTSQSAHDSVAQTVWQGAVYRQSGRTSQWAIRFNENGAAALDFMDGRGFIDTGDWSWTQEGRNVRFTHAPTGNFGEATIHGSEMSGTLTTPASPRDSGSFRFVRR